MTGGLKDLENFFAWAHPRTYNFGGFEKQFLTTQLIDNIIQGNKIYVNFWQFPGDSTWLPQFYLAVLQTQEILLM